jgi:hypothetical protein
MGTGIYSMGVYGKAWDIQANHQPKPKVLMSSWDMAGGITA